MKKIVTNYEVIEKLSKIFGVSIQSVYAALRFKTSGERPDKIRKAAINHGAAIIDTKLKK